MALVTKVAQASMDTSTGMFARQTTGNLYAGEALAVADVCYIKASDGKVYRSNGTAVNEAAKFDGIVARACAVGEPVTLFGLGARFRYGSGLTIGTDLYVAATAGGLDTAPTVGGVDPIARVRTATDIQITKDAERSRISFGGAAVFISAEQTGTGAPQNIAHGLGVAPTKVFGAPTDTSPVTVGVYTMTEGAHDAANVIVTVTSGKKFKVMAWA